jgi:hypothetical protein
MTRDDDPTQPLPAADGTAGPPDAVPTEPMVAPHVPVADAGTADVAAMEPVPAASTGSGVRRAIVVGLSALAAAVIAVLLLSTLPRGEAPAPVESSSPPASPSPSVTVPEVDDGTDSEPDPPDEPEPDPEPTPEPTPEPDPEPEPTPTPTP